MEFSKEPIALPLIASSSNYNLCRGVHPEIEMSGLHCRTFQSPDVHPDNDMSGGN